MSVRSLRYYEDEGLIV
ncbi:hypothetical protein ACF08N_28020 [Streptomyces sp. NPDC015127]